MWKGNDRRSYEQRYDRERSRDRGGDRGDRGGPRYAPRGGDDDSRRNDYRKRPGGDGDYSRRDSPPRRLDDYPRRQGPPGGPPPAQDYDRRDDRRSPDRPARRPRRSGFSDAPPPGSAAGMPPPRDDVVSRAARMGLVPMVPDTSTKPRRELFIGNTPPNVTERMLIDHLNAAMATTKMATGPGPPVIQCRVSANFAFVELRSIEETDRALSLTGLPYLGYVLKVGRPSKYDGQATLCTTWQQMLQDGDYPTAMAAMGGGHSRYASGGGGPGSSSP
mmetsp:Transcript_20848/g.67153  ORF Transcript_20848/g.67153 Transcript_20848/m.67153 type:complete len:276 (+) Transcript_20848:3-830(+)